MAPSPQVKDSKNENKVLYTLKEAEEAGFHIKSTPPPPEFCQFCGKELKRLGVVFDRSVLFWQPSSRCDCKEAVELWEKTEREKKAKEEEEKLERERQRKIRYIESLIGKSGIKKRFQQRCFDNFKTDTQERQKAFNIAKRYADTFGERYEKGEGLYIEGTNGTGKTHLAAAIALQLIKDGIPVICKTSSDMLLDIKNSFDSERVNEAQILSIYKTVDLLIIDDLGKEQCSDWTMSTLYSILNDRYEDMKPTIITTNYGTDDLVRALTPRGYDNSKIIAIISRLKETSRVITMAWADYRSTL